MLCITPSHLMIGQSLRPLPSDLTSYEDENRKMKMSAIERYEARKMYLQNTRNCGLTNTF